LPEHQGRGIGTALLREFINSAHEKGVSATLEVLKANEPARRLYERLGFTVVFEDRYKYDMAIRP
jgi:ribosomal protein S18 acetylase RimI-like enzyme